VGFVVRDDRDGQLHEGSVAKNAGGRRQGAAGRSQRLEVRS
jgi:hypothetical protein